MTVTSRLPPAATVNELDETVNCPSDKEMDVTDNDVINTILTMILSLHTNRICYLFSAAGFAATGTFP